MLGELFNLERILGFCEKFLYFLKINCLFLLSNLPVLLFFLFVGISQVRIYLPLFPLSDSGRTGSQRSIFFHEQDAAGHRNRSVEGLQNGISGYLGIKMSSGSDSVSADLDVLDKCRVLFRSDTVSAPHRFIFPAFCRSGTDDTESVSSGIPLSDEGAGLFQRCSDSAGDKTSTDHRKSRGCGIYPDAA